MQRLEDVKKQLLMNPLFPALQALWSLCFSVSSVTRFFCSYPRSTGIST